MRGYNKPTGITSVKDRLVREILLQFDEYLREVSAQLTTAPGVTTTTTSTGATTKGFVSSLTANSGTNAIGRLNLISGTGVTVTQSEADFTLNNDDTLNDGDMTLKFNYTSAGAYDATVPSLRVDAAANNAWSTAAISNALVAVHGASEVEDLHVDTVEITSVNTPYALIDGDTLILGDCSGVAGDRRATLPSWKNHANRIIHLKRYDQGGHEAAYKFEIRTASGETIDGVDYSSTGYMLWQQGECLTLYAPDDAVAGTTQGWMVLDQYRYRNRGIDNTDSPYTLTIYDDVVLCDASSGAITVNLMAAAGAVGRRFTIKKIDSSANAVTIDGSGAETIDDATTASLSSQYDAVTIQSDGTEWWIL